MKPMGFTGLLLQYLPSMVITASNFVVPLLCDKIAYWKSILQYHRHPGLVEVRSILTPTQNKDIKEDIEQIDESSTC